MAVARCAALGGFARTSQLADAGVSRTTLRRAVDAGAMERLREGVYAHPGVSGDARVAALHGGMVGCISAARALGLWVMPFTGVHVMLAMRGRAHSHPGCECVAHRTTRPIVLGGRSGVGDALLSVLGCQGEEAFVTSLESALRQRRLSANQLTRLRRRMPAARRWLLDFARADADSGLETLLRFRLHAYGVEMRSQVAIPGVGRVDFVLGDRLIIEVDGRGNHADRPRRHKDLVRDAIAAGLGFETLRFDYAMIMHDWPTVRSTVLAKLAAGAHMSPRADASRRESSTTRRR